MHIVNGRMESLVFHDECVRPSKPRCDSSVPEQSSSIFRLLLLFFTPSNLASVLYFLWPGYSITDMN